MTMRTVLPIPEMSEIKKGFEVQYHQCLAANISYLEIAEWLRALRHINRVVCLLHFFVNGDQAQAHGQRTVDFIDFSCFSHCGLDDVTILIVALWKEWIEFGVRRRYQITPENKTTAKKVRLLVGSAWKCQLQTWLVSHCIPQAYSKRPNSCASCATLRCAFRRGSL